MEHKNELSRRKFLSNTALGAIGTIGAAGFLASCVGSEKKAAALLIFLMVTLQRNVTGICGSSPTYAMESISLILYILNMGISKTMKFHI